MAKSQTLSFTITFPNKASSLTAFMAFVAKHGASATLGAPTATATVATPPAPEKPVKSFDTPVAGLEDLTRIFEPLRGPGMLARVSATLGINYATASALVSAESAARRDHRGLMFTAELAPKVSTILANLKPNKTLPILVKASETKAAI